MKISEKLDKLKNEKLEACEALKTSIKALSKEDSKIQESMLNIWADLNNQIEEMEMMVESLAILEK